MQRFKASLKRQSPELAGDQKSDKRDQTRGVPSGGMGRAKVADLIGIFPDPEPKDQHL
jgi:hypothetical protein